MRGKDATPWVLGLVALGVWAMSKKHEEAVGPSDETPRGIVMVNRSLEGLQPQFRQRVGALMRALKARGQRPIIFETVRSEQRAQYLANKGTGKLFTMHRLGLAADILQEGTRWGAPDSFWQALGEEAGKLGLEWGGNWRGGKWGDKGDRPHVQALPAHLDDRLWSLEDTQGRQAVNSAVASYYAGAGAEPQV